MVQPPFVILCLYRSIPYDVFSRSRESVERFVNLKKVYGDVWGDGEQATLEVLHQVERYRMYIGYVFQKLKGFIEVGIFRFVWGAFLFKPMSSGSIVHPPIRKG